jgi:transmembrane sensor
MKTPIRIQLLVAKALRGKISSAEKAELDQWYLQKGTEKNSKLTSTIHTKKAFRSTLNKIDPTNLHHISTWAYLAAACLAAILVVTFWKSPAFEPNEVQETPEERFETIHNEFGTRKVIKLADGSKIWMRGNSELTIPNKFSEDRQVRLKGDAFFEVQRDTLHPFKVISEHAVTEVLGTSFLVSTQAGQQNVAVKTGLVRVTSSTSSSNTDASTLKALEQIQWKSGDGFGSIQRVDPERAFAWVEGKLIFRNTPIIEVLEELKEWYGLEEVIQNEVKHSCVVTGTYTRLSLKEVMESIQYATGINYEIYGKKLKVSKGNC